MKAHVAGSNQQVVQRRHQGRTQYSKVFDQRKRRIRGLWERNGAFYAQLTVTDENTGKKIVRRMRMEDADGNPVPSVAEVSKAMNKVKVKREDHSLSLTPKHIPTFSEYAQQYLTHCRAINNKTKGTIHRESGCINHLSKVMSELRLRQINKPIVMHYMAARKTSGTSARSIKLEVITLRSILRHALAEGLLHDLQIDGVVWLHQRTKQRRLVTADEIERICAAAVEHVLVTGKMLSDFIKLMAYCVGRWTETLRLKWSGVNWERQQLTIGSDGQTKNRKSRIVDFNENLKVHVSDMLKRRQWPSFSQAAHESDLSMGIR